MGGRGIGVLPAALILALAGCQSGTTVVEKDGELVEQACATDADKAKSALIGGALTSVLGTGLTRDKRWLGALLGVVPGAAGGYMISKAEECPDEQEQEQAAAPKPLFKKATAGESRQAR